MNESYILNSSAVNEYSVEQTIIAQKKTKNFMIHLKDFHDYDTVTVYTYNNIDSNTDISVIDDAIRFICSAQPDTPSNIQTKIDSFKLRLFSTLKTIQVVCLTRNYDSHSLNHYLFISSYFKNGDFKIIIPMDFNYNVLDLSFFDIQYDWNSKVDPIRKYLYENSHQYAEFVEQIDAHDSVSFQSVCVINFNVSWHSPILSNFPKNSGTSLNCSRQAQLVLKIIPDFSTNVEMQLLYNSKIIKKSVINNDFSNLSYIVPQLDKFIFPLAEQQDLINQWDLKPILSADFMSADFEPFWLLKDMNNI